MIDEREAVAAFPFLKNVSKASREALLAQALSKSLSHKQVLVGASAECAYLPLVLEGILRVYKTSEGGRELTLYRIERGESCILTATCILNASRFPAIAEAEGRTKVALAPAALVSRFVEENAEWRRFMFGLYARRLDSVLALVEEVAFSHIDMRLASYLLANGGHEGIVDRTHNELASELGTSREVVSRILKDFEVEGALETSRGRIRVIRPEVLEKARSAEV